MKNVMKKIWKLLPVWTALLVLCACGKAQGLVETGVSQLEADEYAAAAQTFGDALSEHHWYDTVKEQDILLLRGEAFMGAGEFDSALKIYEGLLEKDDDNGQLLSDKGMALFGLQRYEEAKEAFLAAVNAGEPSAYEYAGRAAESMEDYEAAEEYYGEAIRNTPTRAALYQSVANCKMLREDYEGALAEIDEGIRQADGKSLQGLLYQQAVCYEYMGEYETALDKMTDYVAQYPEDEAAKKEYEFLLSR